MVRPPLLCFIGGQQTVSRSRAALAEEVRAGQKKLAEAQTALAAAKAAALAAEAETLPNGARHLVARVDGIDARGLQVGTAMRRQGFPQGGAPCVCHRVGS